MNIREHAHRVLLLVFLATYMLSFASKLDIIKIIISLSLLAIIFLSFKGLSFMVKIISLPLVSAGVVILAIHGAPPMLWVEASVAGAGLISVCVVARIMSLPFYYKDYQSDLKDLSARYMNHVLSFLVITMVLVHVMGVFINIAAIPLVYGLLEKNAKLYNAEKLFAISVMEGYITTAFWSPTWPAVPLSLNRFNLMWVDIMPYGILMAVCCMGLSVLCLLFYIKRDSSIRAVIDKQVDLEINWEHLRTFVAIAIALITLIAIVNIISGWSLFLIIPLIAFPFALILAVLQKKTTLLGVGLKEYYRKDLADFGGELMLFSACSFFAKSLTLVDIAGIVTKILPETRHSFVVCLVVISLMVLVAFFGINGLTTSSALIYSINPASWGLSNIAFSMTMAAGYGLTALAVPFTATALLIGKLTKRPLWEVSVKWNWAFTILSIIVLSLVISLIP